MTYKFLPHPPLKFHIIAETGGEDGCQESSIQTAEALKTFLLFNRLIKEAPRGKYKTGGFLRVHVSSEFERWLDLGATEEQ